MTRELVLQAWRSSLGSFVRMSLAAFLLLAPLVSQAIALDAAVQPAIVAYACLPLMAGTLATDRRQGVLRAVLGRPVERWRILAGRFLGLLGACSLVGAATLLLSHGLAAVTASAPLSLRAIADDVAHVPLHLMPLVAWCVAVSAVLPWGSELVTLAAAAVVRQIVLDLVAWHRETLLSWLELPFRSLFVEAHGLQALLAATSVSAVVLCAGVLAFNWAPLPAEARS